MLPWILLACAIMFEVAGTTAMKLSGGFSKLIPSILIFVCYGLCFTVLTFTLKKIEVSTVYAIWSGVGTALIAVIGILYFKESVSFIKVISIALIIAGVVGLQLGTNAH
ncbi:MAG: multidrug efflux SMR transporter [Desulfobacterales bacterium]|nr:multidrug efflux SMR transporter [Desulfobacterales bacterium]